MSRNVVLVVAVMLALSINFPSSAVAMPTDILSILPEECKILGGKELELTLEGSLPPNSTVDWNVSDGGILSALPGWNATFFAPTRSTTVTISASISPAVPGVENPITRQCIVISPITAPDGVASVPSLSFPIN